MFLPFIGFGQSDIFGEKTGCISGDCTNGYGTYIFSNGSKYVGEWRNDKQYGQGTYTWGKGEWEGDKYIGEFKDGKKYGQGTYTFKSGEVRKGKWINGVYQTPVKVECNRKSKIAIAD